MNKQNAIDTNSKYYKKEQKLSIIEIDQGIILPGKSVPDGPNWGIGGVCEKDGEFVEQSYYDGGWAQQGGRYDWNPGDEKYIDDIAVYIGLFTMHWGHFLIDMTNRLWAVPEILKEHKDARIVFLGDEEPAGNPLRFFQLLGVDEKQLVHVKEPTRFRKVLIPEQAFKPCSWYTEEHVGLFDYVIDRALKNVGGLAAIDNSKKIYFTRRDFRKAKQSEFGEKYYEKRFHAAGYELLSPEKMDLEEQIYVWNHAEYIACMNGSIILNLIFSRNNNLHVAVLDKTSIFHENPYILSEIRNISLDFFDTYKEPLNNYPKSLGEGPFLLWSNEGFDEYASENQIPEIMNCHQKKIYFCREKIKFFWCVLAIKKHCRNIASKVVPQKVKDILRGRRA